MSSFRIIPIIQTIDTLNEFIDEFQINNHDLIFTRSVNLIFTDRYLYESYFKTYKFSCIIQDDYGPGEPTDVKVDAIRSDYLKYNCDRVIAIGGGTVIDIAKLMVLADWTDCLSLFRKEIHAIHNKKLVIIPTTCGTGSEITNISIVAFHSINSKLGLADDALFADNAVLIPMLLENIPLRVFLHSSIDALIHAVESYLSPKANKITRLFSFNAITIIIKGYDIFAQNGMKLSGELLGDFLLASNFAGIAFSNAGCGLIHAMSYPISGEYHLSHGESNYELLIAVLNFYKENDAGKDLKELIKLLSTLLGCNDLEVITTLKKLLEQLIVRRPMKGFGMDEFKAVEFAIQVKKNQQRLLANCYVPVKTKDITDIYKQIL